MFGTYRDAVQGHGDSMPAKHDAAVPRAPCNRGSGAAFDVLDIGNPVALSSRKARLFPFTIEACRRATKERLINAFERVDADNRVEMVVDPTGDDGHYAAPGAGVELCGSGTECVLGYERRIFDHYLQSAAWIGGPYAAVLGAKRSRCKREPEFQRDQAPKREKRRCSHSGTYRGSTCVRSPLLRHENDGNHLPQRHSVAGSCRSSGLSSGIILEAVRHTPRWQTQCENRLHQHFPMPDLQAESAWSGVHRRPRRHSGKCTSSHLRSYSPKPPKRVPRRRCATRRVVCCFAKENRIAPPRAR